MLLAPERKALIDEEKLYNNCLMINSESSRKRFISEIAAETAVRAQVFDLDDGIPHNHSLFGDIVTKLK